MGFAYHRAYRGICSGVQVPCRYLTDRIVEFGANSVCKYARTGVSVRGAHSVSDGGCYDSSQQAASCGNEEGSAHSAVAATLTVWCAALIVHCRRSGQFC